MFFLNVAEQLQREEACLGVTFRKAVLNTAREQWAYCPYHTKSR